MRRCSSQSSSKSKLFLDLTNFIVFRRDRITLLEAEEENKRMEQLRIDEEKRRDERKKDSTKVDS
jgi:hypothetical protein